jgi:hypothetical protein
MSNEQKRIVRIGLPFTPYGGHFEEFSLAKGSTVMGVTDQEVEFLGRLVKKLNRSGSPIQMVVQPMDEPRQ